MRILFICPDINKPVGGIKQIYRQVDVLNKNGFQAYILHENNNFKCTWFNNETKILYNKQVFNKIETLRFGELKGVKKIRKLIKKLITFNIKNITQKNIIFSEKDILVIPEVYGSKISKLLPGVKKVIYNQGCYQTFFGYDLNLKNKETPYLHKDLISIIVNSENGRKYLKYSFPNKDLYRVHYGIDKKNFNFSSDKKRQIAYMPRRLRVDLLQIINILKFRGAFDNWDLVEIDNMSESMVARTLKESAIFLNFSINEGFGMPPAEAMACGCIVIGYPGKGGEEFFNKDFSYPIPDRNVLKYAEELERILLSYDKDEAKYLAQGKKASEFILKEYAIEVEENDIRSVWNSIFEKNNLVNI